MRRLLLAASLLAAAVGPAFADAVSEYEAGKAAYAQNNYAEAIQHYSNAIALKPDARVYVERGNAYDDSGRSDLAIADYTAAIAMAPKYADGYANRGVALRPRSKACSGSAPRRSAAP
jgi:tetratricopeptide (TPR) repeat protein